MWTPFPIHANVSTLSLLLIASSLAVKIFATLWLNTIVLDGSGEYTYLGDDYPERWPIDIPDTLMASDNSMRFQLDTPDGIAEWSSIVPGSGLVYLGPHWQPYTISLFHQLRCLDIIRDAMVRDHGNGTEGPTPLARHCLNYVKQMVLCRGDLQLEPFLAPSHIAPIDLYGTYECKDWGVVYEAAERNGQEYTQWLKRQKTHRRRDDALQWAGEMRA